MPTCSKSSCCGDKASQAQPSRATIDIAETCSGKVCDEDCIKAAAAFECQSACANHGSKTADHCSKNDNPVFSACAEHLRTAFDKYAILLEQTRCICSRVLEEQKLKCQSDDAASTRSGRSSASIEHGAAVLRQRRNLPCFDKRAVLRSCGTTRSKSSCCASAKQAVSAATTRGENDLDKSSCCSVGLAATGTTARSSNCGRLLSTPTPLDCSNTATKVACNAIAIKNCGMSPCCDDNVSPKASSDYKTAEGMDLEQASGQEHVVFSVAGMECTGCEGIVHKALGKLPGVSHLRVTFVTATASCDIDSSITSVDEVIRTMQRTTKYKLSRFEDRDQYLDVVSSHAVLDSLASVKGINTMKRLNKTTVRLGYDAAVIGARSILAQCPGASLAPPSRDQALSAGTKHLWKILAYATTAAILTLPVLILAWASTSVPEATKQIISLSLATLVQAIAVPVFYNPAISALITSRMIEMDMLVVISITAAYGYSLIAFVIERSGTALETGPFFETSTLLITLVLLGRLIAAYARKTAVASVSLRSLQANMASLVGKDGTTSTIDARLLQFDDTIIIQPSSQIVTDGTIISGTSEVDESMVTGESLPVMKISGDDVIAGTVNGNGVITIQVTRLPGGNTITDIAKLVEQAQSGKPRVQALADKVAGYFIPVVVAISMLVTIVWIAVEIAVLHKGVGAAIGSAITYGIAVLAISCPCALGLAVPMVLVVTGGRAARAGIIIKTADVSERGFKVTDVVFDKTGTLTEDKLAIVEETCLEQDNLSQDQIVGLLKAMVRDNNHPVSKAMSLHLQDRAGTDVEISEITALPGLGVTCLSGDVLYSAGSAELGEVSDHPLVQQMKSQGLTLFCLARGGQLLAVYGLKATARAESKAVIAALQSRHIAVHVVSGDTQQAVDLLAEDLNLPANQAHGRKAPAQKQDYVKRLMSEGKVVLFCGDGTNDAIAVTQADVGVQITPTASDVTRATADVILMSNDLTGVLQLLDISRAAYIRICFNFLWAALYNIFAILLASGAFVRFRIEPAYAGLGEIVSVLPVVLTALTIRKPKRIAA